MKNAKRTLQRVLFATMLMIYPLLGGAQEKVYRFDKPLYGAAYYAEYTPTDRLDEDIRLMKEAGLTVVRVGESTWSLFEPEEGRFEFAWLDRTIDALHKAGIKVILGTPTYSIPAWMAKKYPDVLSKRWDGVEEKYGIRQNMDLLNKDYRRLSERIIRKMMEHYAQHPAIIGYQVDNEVEARKIDNEDYFEGFKEYIKQEFKGDLKELNRRWGLNYWGMNINTWDEFYDRPGVTNPSYKVWWERWDRKVTADFLNWQIDIVNEYKRPDQFVGHCFMTMIHRIDQVEAFRQMEYPFVNVYYTMQDAQNGSIIAYMGDYLRKVSKSGNFLVTETNAQGTGWSSYKQYPPYDGQLRQNMYSFIANGANMVEYWHWSTLHYGQETYWRGILGHEGKPNRVYREFQKGAKELEKIGKDIVNIRKPNRVAMLFSHDSNHALNFMPWAENGQTMDRTAYDAMYMQNIECDIIPVDKDNDFAGYDMLVIPPLYVATDETLQKISDFVKNGGEVVMFFKSGYTDYDNAVRTDVAPGPLTACCGLTYQEYSTINKIKTKATPDLGVEDSYVEKWMEFLQPTTATPLAYADHEFFGKWPCITENSYGKGHVIYIGTVPSRELLNKLVARAAERKGINTVERQYQFPIILRSGINERGKNVHYIFNYSSKPQSIKWPYGKCKSLLDAQKLEKDALITIEPWDQVIGLE